MSISSMFRKLQTAWIDHSEWYPPKLLSPSAIWWERHLTSWCDEKHPSDQRSWCFCLKTGKKTVWKCHNGKKAMLPQKQGTLVQACSSKNSVTIWINDSSNCHTVGGWVNSLFLIHSVKLRLAQSSHQDVGAFGRGTSPKSKSSNYCNFNH